MGSPRAPGWLEDPAPGPLARAARAPLAPAAWAWEAGAWLHRHARGARFRAPARLPCRVVSVGSVVVGGSGKTPAAAWVASALRARGHAVAIASRGYGRRGRHEVLVVSDGRHVRAWPHEAGDEPAVLAAHAPGVPVLVGRDRARVGQHAVTLFGCDVLVLDDGFQHHRLARDVELLVFDGGGLGSGRLLPLGPLRERLGEVRRADALLVVDGPLPERDAERLERAAPDAPRFAARRRPVSLRPLRGGAPRAPVWLAGRPLGLLSGLARPAALRRTVQALGAQVTAERTFPDHHRYRPEDLRRLAGLWVTTEKDAVKILPSWCEGVDLQVLAIELELAEPEAFLGWLGARL
ncbi:MAG: tetraacyldisaccharide 4'-kinase [Deltaproteobacteria bacterium]|nr:tetraacyldisaccharide 4'-kinase [Deltaproteobacteria bacterium]